MVKLFHLVIIAIISIPFIFIIHRELKTRQQRRKQRNIEVIEESGIFETPGDRLLETLRDPNFIPFTAERDPQLLEYAQGLPTRITYFDPDSLSPDEKNLLFGTSVLPTRGVEFWTRAPEHESQLQTDVGKARRYDTIGNISSYF